MERPIAIRTYRPPSTSPLTVCESRISSIVRARSQDSGHLAADFFR
jgi:hypothetical protein